MNKDFAKIPENAESKAVDREKEEYPVQQVAVTYPIGEKEVKDAVKELNPDTDSLGSIIRKTKNQDFKNEKSKKTANDLLIAFIV